MRIQAYVKTPDPKLFTIPKLLVPRGELAQGHEEMEAEPG